jgi:hypothetical protein
MLISNPLKKFFKNILKKSYKQNKFDEHEYSGKVHISVTVLLITSLVHKKSFFNRFEISVQFCVFLYSN